MTGFVRAKNPSVTLTLTPSTSARVALPTTNVKGVRVYWDGASPVFFQSGNSTVVSSLSAGSLTAFLPTGSVEMFDVDPNDTHISAISTASGTLYIQSSSGD